MSIRYSAPGVPGGEVSPGAGSTGFTSAGVAFANSSGQLKATSALQYADHATSGQLTVASTNLATTGAGTGAIIVGLSSSPTLGIAPDRIQARTSASVAQTLILNPNGGAINIGTSAASGSLLTLASTGNVSTQVGVAGNAAAPPATPEVYVKIRVPNAGHTLTTLYLPCYASTG